MVSSVDPLLDLSKWLLTRYIYEGLFEDASEFGGVFGFGDRFLAFADDEAFPATGFGPFGDPITTITLPSEGNLRAKIVLYKTSQVVSNNLTQRTQNFFGSNYSVSSAPLRFKSTDQKTARSAIDA